MSTSLRNVTPQIGQRRVAFKGHGEVQACVQIYQRDKNGEWSVMKFTRTEAAAMAVEMMEFATSMEVQEFPDEIIRGE